MSGDTYQVHGLEIQHSKDVSSAQIEIGVSLLEKVFQKQIRKITRRTRN